MTTIEAPNRPTMTEYALVDTAIMGLPVFRPLPRRGREDARHRLLDLKTTHGGLHLRVASPTMGADDLSVLLAICGLAGLDGKKLESAHSETHRLAIIDGLESHGDVVGADHLRVRTTVYAIVREAGLAHGGEAYRRVTESLFRLRGVYYADRGHEGANSRRLIAGGRQNLVGFDADEENGEIRVVLNARFAAAILGGKQHTRVDLVEHRVLSEAGRLLHLVGSVSVRPGGLWRIRLDALVERVYGEPATTDRQRRDRRVVVRAALTEIGGLADWSVDENGRRLVTIRRARRPRK